MKKNYTFLYGAIFALLASLSVTTTLPAQLSDAVFIDAQVADAEVLGAAVASDTEAFHLFSHGRPGELLIEEEWLDAPQLANWLADGRLVDKTSLSIYGCHFGQGEKGQQAVAYLEKALGIPVAASDDLTGINGDWELEVASLTPKALKPKLQSYPHDLQLVCGVDIHVANDNSGSVDAEENRQSRAFVSQLGLSFAPLGTSNTESRVSVSTWANTGTFEEYSFPLAGPNYTTSLSDVLSYANSPRTFSGGTNVYDALLKASQVVGQNPISGRIAPMVIVLMTDASCGQISNNIVPLATQLKSQGVYIVVMAIDAASTCPVLQGSNVASPGGYFAAGDYDVLFNDAIAFINAIRATACANAGPPEFDLTVSLSNFEITNCNPGPASASADYTVTNNSFGENFNGNLQISFYNGDPTLPGTQYLFTENAGTQSIALGGGTFSGTINDPSLVNTATLYAVVNFDGGAVGNGVPLMYSMLPTQITVPDEGDVGNNISSAASRTDGTGCLPFAELDVQVTNSGVGCGDQVTYTVQVCNTGTGDAAGFSLQSFAPTGGVELDSSLIVDPFIVQPAGLVQLGSDIDGESSGDGSSFLNRNTVSISADGSTVAMGSAGSDNGGVFAGQVRIFDYNGTNWVQRGNSILGQDPYRRLSPNSLSLDGNTIAVGGPTSDGNATPYVQVYDWNGTSWVQRGATFNITDAQTISLSADGNILAVSEAGYIINTSTNFGRGRVGVFEWNGSSWVQRGSYIIGETSSEAFGTDVALSNDGNTLVAGGYAFNTRTGVVRVYDWNGATWVKRGSNITGLGINDDWGQEVALSSDGNTIVSGSGGDDYARVFNWNGSSWVQQGPTVNTLGSLGSVDISGDGSRFVFGANEQLFGPTGIVTVYDWNGSAWIQYGMNIVGEAAIDQAMYPVLSEDGNYIAIAAPGNDGNGNNSGHVRVFSDGGVGGALLPAGACATYQYTYDISGLAAGTYDYSVDVSATPDTGDDPVQYSPNTNFTVGGNTGLNGFDGAQNNTDDLTYSGSSPACPVGDQVTVSVAMTGDGSCPGDFGTATITIDNQSGQTLSNALLNLDLTGTGTVFGGEPYNKTNGLVLAEPNIFDPAYPNVPNALSGKTGMQQLAIFTLPAGTSTFELDYEIGTTVTGLSAEVAQLPTSVNASGTASGSNSITPATLPGISGSCPADVTAAATTLSLNYTATNAASVMWNSGSSGSFTNPAAATTTYNINDIDRANGYVDLALRALSAEGCDSLITCRVLINGIDYDYGDAPATYDLNESLQPVAAAATISPDIFLGQTGPDTEATTQASVDATGDGADEDGLLSIMLSPATPGQTNYPVTIEVTNNSGGDVYAYGFMDWNDDGDWNADADERSALLTIPTGGLSTQTLLFNVAAGYTGGTRFLRLRLSSDEVAVGNFFGPAANGEVEDYFAEAQLANPSISLVKTGTFVDSNGDGFAQAGETISYSFTVTNSGDVELTNVTVTDPLVTVMGGPLASLAVGASDATTFTATYTLTPADINAGSVTNEALVTGTDPVGDPVTSMDQAVTDLPIEPTADLAIVKTVDNAVPDVGATVVFTLTVTNNGPSDATNVVVNDLLPSGLSYVSDNGGGAYNSGTGIWTIGALPLSGTVSLLITATVNQTGNYLNIARVTGNEPDPDPTNNIDAEEVTPVCSIRNTNPQISHN